MANWIYHAGIPFPVQSYKYTVLIPYLDADGDPVDPTSPDTEISKDGGAFADCANEVTTIAGSNGVGYLSLTGQEMNAWAVVIAAKSANAKTTILTMTPATAVEIGGVYSVVSASGEDVTVNLADVEAAFGRRDVRMEGLWFLSKPFSGLADFQARPIRIFNSSTGVVSVTPGWETDPLAGGPYSFGFPLGTGTVMDQILRTGGGFAR